jgi:hypothetical protein
MTDIVDRLRAFKVALGGAGIVMDEAADEIERLRGIIYRNCDWRKAAILSSDEDAAVIRKICDADEAP